jgi:predicted methyltransferase
MQRLHIASLLLTMAVFTACSTLPTSAPVPPTPVAADKQNIEKAPRLTTSDAATLARIDEILAGPQRTAAERQRDDARHPRETLDFFGLRADMTVMEVWPGGAGWYASILAPLLKDRGRYIAAEHDPVPESAYARETVRALRAKFDANPGVYGKAQIVALQAPTALSPVTPGSVDLVVSFRNLHNWMARPGQADAMLAAIYTALKPGGTLGLVDHRADRNAPVDPLAKLGYVNEFYAIELVEKAGFEFVGSAEINANPNDTHDWEQGVWTLPPTLRLGDKDRDRYLSVGESDRFTLRFRKPLAH